MPLAEHRELSTPLTLAVIRTAKPELKAIVDRLGTAHRKPLYFPFELSDRPVRPNQGYSFKLPADFVDAFPALARISTNVHSVLRTSNKNALFRGFRGNLRRPRNRGAAAALCERPVIGSDGPS